MSIGFFKGVLNMSQPSSAPHRLGQVLLSQGRITQAQLEKALKLQTTTHQPIGEALISLGYLSQPQLKQALKKQNRLRAGAIYLTAILAPFSVNCLAEKYQENNITHTTQTQSTENYQYLNKEANAQDWLKTAAKAVWILYQAESKFQEQGNFRYSLSHNDQVGGYQFELSYSY